MSVALGWPGTVGAATDMIDAGRVVFTQVPIIQGDAGLSALNPAYAFAAGVAPTGSRIVLLDRDNRLVQLSEGFAAACDPEISFDARRLLFAGRREGDVSWAIWEIALNGAAPGQAPRRITDPRQQCRQPIYLSTLFTLNSPEPWYTLLYVGRDAAAAEAMPGGSASLYSIQLNGTEQRRLTVNPGPDLDPCLMPDGRVVYSGWTDRRDLDPTGPRQVLCAINLDGTDLERYGATQGTGSQRMPCITDTGWVVFVEAAPLSPDGSGQLAGVRARRPHHSYQAFTQDAGYAYLYPAAASGSRIWVSRRPTQGAGNAGLFTFDLADGRVELVFDSPDYHEVQARRVGPRPVPDGRSTVVDPSIDYGVLYALNCYDADARLQPKFQPERLRRLRVLEGLPHPDEQRPASSGLGAVRVARRVLGEVPLESDGSFNVQVPADVPLELQLIDERGLALATCGWIWVKPKENRGCIGCHEDPERTPENVFVQAVRRPSYVLTAPPEDRRRLGFLEDVPPVSEEPTEP